MTSQNNYCSAKRSVDADDKRWVDEINQNTQRIFDNIDNYILNTSRPPSNAAPGTPVRLSPANSAPSHHSFHRQSSSTSVTIPSPDFASALDHERRRCNELEKQLAQIQFQEKEKIKRAVEAERILLAAEHNKVYNDKIKKVQLAAKQVEDENDKFRSELLAERKKANGL